MRAKRYEIEATTPDGEKIPIGTIGSAERAAELRQRLADELGDEYVRLQILERELHGTLEEWEKELRPAAEQSAA